MTDAAARYDRIASAFTARVEGVPDGGWDAPTQCEGWAARDVVAHLCEWVPAFFAGQWGLAPPDGPPAGEDPVGAWHAFDRWARRALADPELAAREAGAGSPIGPQTFAAAFDQIATTDVLLHTWDLARATGQDEHLDPDEVATLLPGMAEAEEAMRASGHYGPATPVAEDADPQTRLLAFIGRRP